MKKTVLKKKMLRRSGNVECRKREVQKGCCFRSKKKSGQIFDTSTMCA